MYKPSLRLVAIDEGFQVLPTFLCASCGWLAGTNEADQVFCNNPICSQRGKLFSIEIRATEVKGIHV